MTWEELKNAEIGTIYHDEMRGNMRFIVMRGPASLCAYIGIPVNHPLAGHSYDCLPVQVHGGLTYANKGDGMRPEGYWWYGWDYGHAGDKSFYDDIMLRDNAEKEWYPEDVVKDSWSAFYDFDQLINLAEAIFNKVMGWRKKMEGS